MRESFVLQRCWSSSQPWVSSPRGSRAGVVVRWQTEAAAGVLGFNLYRERLGPRVKLNRSLIATRSAGVGYAWRDRRPGRSPRYFLEELRLDGGRVWHGPAA